MSKNKGKTKAVEHAVVELAPTKTFKMNKATKTLLARINDPVRRAAIKADEIRAQLISEETDRKGRKGFLEMFKGQA